MACLLLKTIDSEKIEGRYLSGIAWRVCANSAGGGGAEVIRSYETRNSVAFSVSRSPGSIGATDTLRPLTLVDSSGDVSVTNSVSPIWSISQHSWNPNELPFASVHSAGSPMETGNRSINKVRCLRFRVESPSSRYSRSLILQALHQPGERLQALDVSMRVLRLRKKCAEARAKRIGSTQTLPVARGHHGFPLTHSHSDRMKTVHRAEQFSASVRFGPNSNS